MASFLILLAEVVARYILGSSMEWTDEFSRFLLVWMTFTGIGFVVLEKKEIFVQVFRPKLSEKGRRLWSLFIDSLTLLFNLLLIGYGISMTRFAWDIKTESLEWPFSYFYAAIPLGAVLALYFLGKRIREYAGGWGEREK